MSLNLSPLQHYALESIGIAQWQLREPISEPVSELDIAALPESVTVSPSETPDTGPLQQQIQLAIDFCSKQLNRPMIWATNNELTAVKLVDNQLQLPPLGLFFSDPTLKRQLWTILQEQR